MLQLYVLLYFIFISFQLFHPNAACITLSVFCLYSHFIVTFSRSSSCSYYFYCASPPQRGVQMNLSLCIFHSAESLERSRVWFLHCRLHGSSKTPLNSERCPLTTMPKPLTTLNLHSFLQLMESPLVVSTTQQTNANLSCTVPAVSR